MSELIAKYQANHPCLIAKIYAFRNQPDKAFEWLDRAYASHDDELIFAKAEPLLNSLHNDPRFVALLEKLNLPT